MQLNSGGTKSNHCLELSSNVPTHECRALFTIFVKMTLLAKFWDGWTLGHMSVLIFPLWVMRSQYFLGTSWSSFSACRCNKRRFLCFHPKKQWSGSCRFITHTQRNESFQRKSLSPRPVSLSLPSQPLTRSHVALDYGLSIVPTKEWQDNLSKRLAYGSSQKSCPEDISVPAMQKRRLNNNVNKQCDWDSLYKIEPAPGTKLWPFARYSRLQIYRRRSSKHFRGHGTAIFRWESGG